MMEEGHCGCGDEKDKSWSRLLMGNEEVGIDRLDNDAKSWMASSNTTSSPRDMERSVLTGSEGHRKALA